jgi:large subunit ribosomal protein L1
MSKKQKASPSQLAMSEVLEREFKQDVAPEQVEVVSQKPEKTTDPKTKRQVRKRGKKYIESAQKVKNASTLSTSEAVKAIQKAVFSKFEETLELHVNVIENGIRGEVELPNSTGKKVIVVEADDALIEKLEKGIVDFDVLVATPAIMPKLTKFAKLLGPKGLMPNPKAGTIGPNTSELMKKFTGNTVRFKTEPKSPIIHVTVGKTSSSTESLEANIEAYLNAIGRKKIKNAYLASTMTPSVQIVI